MPLDVTPMPRAPAATLEPHRHRAPFWRGAAGAIALAAWSVVGVLGAALALIPIALERGPRGRVRRVQPEAAVHRLGGSLELEEAASAEPVPAARAAGEAFPR